LDRRREGDLRNTITHNLTYMIGDASALANGGEL
jgi:hypothetical protein